VANPGAAAPVKPGAPTAGKPGGGKPGGPGAGRPAVVTVEKAGTQRIEERVNAVGSLLAAQSVLVKPEIAGRLDKVMVTDGQQVSQGTNMFALDRSVTEAELAQARAELSLAQANLKRTRNLASQAFVSERSRDEALSNARVLEARLQVVQARLAKTTIEAPFDGVVGLVQVSRGDYLQAGTTLVRLDDLSSLKLDLRVPERLFARLTRGQKVRVSFDAYPDREFVADIETIDSQLDDAGRSIMVRGRLDNREGLLRPGMFARARLVLGSRNEAVMVSEASLIPDRDVQYVYVVRDKMAHRVAVRTGVRQDGKVEILDGVAAGEQVVATGQLNLRGEQMPVRIVGAPDAKSAAVTKNAS
jgi:membrane fusion protein (multidrug efflux system)